MADTFSLESIRGRESSNRNLIINGAMTVAQRGTSSTSTGYQTVDRFTVDSGNTDELAFTQSQSTTVPSGQGFAKSLKVEVTTAETALASDEHFRIQQKIEAQNLQHLAYGTSSAKSITFSFWVRSSLTGKYSILIYQDDATRSNTPSFTISTADTWEKKTITLDGDTGGTINDDNGVGFIINFILAAGTDLAGTPHTGWGAYTATDDFAHDDQVNFIAQTGTFYITGVQLEVGSQATPFEHRSYGDELARCQRYYQKVTSSIGLGMGMVFPESTTLVEYAVDLPVSLRAAPTTSTVSETGDLQVKYGSTNVDVTGVQTLAYSQDYSHISLRLNCSHGQSTSTVMRLRTDSSNSGLIFDAEL